MDMHYIFLLSYINSVANLYTIPPPHHLLLVYTRTAQISKQRRVLADTISSERTRHSLLHIIGTETLLDLICDGNVIVSCLILRFGIFIYKNLVLYRISSLTSYIFRILYHAFVFYFTYTAVLTYNLLFW